MKLYVVNRLFNDYSTDMVPTCEGIFTTQAKAEKMVRGLVFNDGSADMTPTCEGIFTSQVCAEKMVRGMVFVESLENEKKDDLILRNEEYTMIRYITLEDATITYTIEEVNA